MSYSPSISVVMPVYNYGQFIKESIDSVLAQTFSDFELIVLNDGSSDNSSEIAHSYLDKRVKVIDFPEKSVCYSTVRNAGMSVATGKHICVMDADDVCLPDRLENQYRFLEENPEFGLIGGAYYILNTGRISFRETDYETIKVHLLKYCYLHHPTCMIRSSLVRKHHLFYSESYKYSADFDWEVRASSLFPVSNINTPVLLYRVHARQVSSSKRREQFSFVHQIRVKQLSFFGIEPSELEKALHIAFIHETVDPRFDENAIDQWIVKLLEANRRTGYFSQQKLKSFLQAHQYRYTHLIRQT